MILVHFIRRLNTLTNCLNCSSSITQRLQNLWWQHLKLTNFTSKCVYCLALSGIALTLCASYYMETCPRVVCAVAEWNVTVFCKKRKISCWKQISGAAVWCGFIVGFTIQRIMTSNIYSRMGNLWQEVKIVYLCYNEKTLTQPGQRH